MWIVRLAVRRPFTVLRWGATVPARRIDSAGLNREEVSDKC